MSKRADLLIVNANNVLTLAGPARPRVGDEMNRLGEVRFGSVAVGDGKIIEVGAEEELRSKYADAEQLDANYGIVMPGFVDCHTHALFPRVRSEELTQRIAGASYLDILAAGGGIHQTVRETVEANFHQLTWMGRRNLRQVLAHGTTTAEVKTGYGLRFNTERKMLESAAALNRNQPVDVVPTFLGAHAVPPKVDRADHVDMVVNDCIPEFAGMAEFCDVYCEQGAFTLDDTRRIFDAAKAHGYKLKVHAGQFNDLGAAGLAAEYGAISADHLEEVSDDQLRKMADAGTTAVLLPGSSFYLLNERYADARRMIDMKVPVAIATDFNPGSCPSCSMQMMMSLACMKMGMTTAEAFTAATINAAYALDRGDEIGSIEPGKRADLVILELFTEQHLPCHVGMNLIRDRIKDGKVVTPSRL